MYALNYVIYGLLLTLSIVYSHGRHHEEHSSEERECEYSRVAGSDYIDMITSHADYFNTSSVYPNNVELCWHITAELGGRVQITFTSFHLQPRVNGVCVDWVRVTDGEESETFYCGDLSETRIESTGHDLTVTFHTDNSVGSSGFMAEFYAVDWSYRPHAGPVHVAVISVIIIVLIMAVIIFTCNVLIYAMCKKYKYKKTTSEPVVEPSEKPISEYPQVVLSPLPPKC